MGKSVKLFPFVINVSDTLRIEIRGNKHMELPVETKVGVERLLG